MEDNKEMLELLRRIERANRRQTCIGWVLCILLLISGVCCVVALQTVYDFLPQASQVVTQVSQVLSQMEAVLTDLEQVTGQLAALDLGNMVSDVDTLVQTAQQSLTQTMDKLNTIDFQTLNQAIEDLAAVVEPLAKIPSLFR